MRDWNAHILIAFGFVLGATAMLVAAPYFMAVELIEGTNRVSGLLEGYGDIYGSIITAVMALIVGLFLWRIQEDKKDRADAEVRAILAHHLGSHLERFYMILQAMNDGYTRSEHLRDTFITSFRNRMDFLDRQINKLFALDPLDERLGSELVLSFQSMRSSLRVLVMAVRDAQPDHIPMPEVNHGYHRSFERVWAEVKEVYAMIDTLRKAGTSTNKSRRP